MTDKKKNAQADIGVIKNSIGTMITRAKTAKATGIKISFLIIINRRCLASFLAERKALIGVIPGSVEIYKANIEEQRK